MSRDESLIFIQKAKFQCVTMLIPDFFFLLILKVMKLEDCIIDLETAIKLLWALGIGVMVLNAYAGWFYIRLDSMQKILEENPNTYIAGDFQHLCKKMLANPFILTKINKGLIRTIKIEE